MYIRVDEIIKSLEEEYEPDEQAVLFNIKVKRCRSTKTSTNPEFPKEEEAA